MTRSTRIQLIVLAVILAVIAAPFLIPLSVYRGPLERAASQALSRDVHIRGPLRLTVYPDVGLSLSDVSVGNLPGARDREMIGIENLTVGARFWPLLSGQLQVTELTLQKPTIRLELGKNATPNWSFSDPRSGRPADAGALNRIGFSHMNIREGTITYSDVTSGKSATLNAVSLSLDMPERATPTLARPLTLNGALTYNGETLKLNGRLDNFGALLGNKRTGARLSIGSNVINAEFTGVIATDGISGALKLGAHSVRSFAAWMGNPLPPGNGLGLIALEGQFTARDGIYTLRQTHFAFDSMNVNGDIVLDTNPELLSLKAYGSINRLDLNPYLAPGATTDTVEAAKAKAANPDAPFSLSGLKAVNAEIRLVLGELVLPHLKLDQAVVRGTLNGGVLKADLTNVTAYGGSGKGTLTVDASGATPLFQQALEVTGVKVQLFLKETIGVDDITGTGVVRFDIASRGDTGKAIVSSLSGKGDIRFTDGSITGVDLAGVTRVVNSVLDGELPSNVAGAGTATPFAQMGASFTIQNGVMHSNNIQLTSRAVQIGGRGDVDLSNRALEFHLAPKPGVPFYVKGPWRDPDYGPDVRSLVKSVGDSLTSGAVSPVDLLTNPGGALKAIIGTRRKTN